jgi:mRNA interferase MazF
VKRGDIYRVYKATAYNSKKYRLFVVVSRRILVDSKFSTVICAPVYTRYDGLSTQIKIGIEQGVKHFSSIH